MKISEHIKFSMTMFLLPWIPAFLFYKHSYITSALLIIIAFVFVSFICFLNKKTALEIKEIFAKTGRFTGKYLAIAILFAGYIAAVIPTGLLMKAVKRDRLRLKKQELSSYWINYDNKSNDYEYQF